MIHLILLAAGNSRRFGSENKLLYPIDGIPMIEHILSKLESLIQKNPWDITVVTQKGRIAELIERHNVKVVFNPDSALGISTSIRCALDNLPADESPAAFFVADQPRLKKATIEAFLNACLNSEKGLGCVKCGDQTGNPTFFSAKYFESLRTLVGDKGGKRIILSHLNDCFFYEIDDKDELIDIDTLLT